MTRRRQTVMAAVLGLLVGASLVAGVAAAYDFRFEDVPSGDTFASDITWLHLTGVTRGCNPPDNTLFCPDDPVTREQMAAFLHRFSDNVVFGHLRSGEVDRGVWALDQNPGWSTQLAITLPRPFLWTPTVEVVESGSTSNCPGTVGAPEAEPGYLCVYVGEALNLVGMYPWQTYPFGAILAVDPAGDGWTFASGTWAAGGIDAG